MQLHWVDTETGEIGRKKLVRAKLSAYFAQLQPVRVVMEVCGSAHHWARVLGALGHELLPARQVRAFVRSNKDDAADARTIWLAAQQSDIRRAPIKTVSQQAVLALHRTRQHWVSVRTATVNALRGTLYEFGVTLSGGRQAGLKALGRNARRSTRRFRRRFSGSSTGNWPRSRTSSGASMSSRQRSVRSKSSWTWR
jgi:transposase